MKKLLTTLALILLIGVNCLFSACSLVTINNSKYLSQTVASVDDITISMEDLVLGYNSFGYNYVQQNSMTAEQAVKQTLEDLINRELLLKKAKEKFGELSITKQNEVWKEVYDYVNSQIKTYVEEIAEKEGLTILYAEDKTEESVQKFTPYEKKVTRKLNEDGVTYSYSRVKTEETETDTELIQFVLDEYGIEGLAQRGYSKYINNVKKSRDEYKDLNESEIFEKECQRIYKIYEKNKYATMFQEDYELNMEIDLQKIKDKYIELVRNSAFQYQYDESAYNTKMQDTSSGAGEVYYQPFGEKYIQVAHVLLKYSDEQTEEIKKLETKLNAGYITPEKYQSEIERISSQITVKNRLDENAPEKTVSEVFEEINATLNACGTDENAKIEKFIEFIEMYNGDDGILSALNNQSQYYAINLDTNVTDTMIKEFADASRSLYSPDGSKDFTIYEKPVLGSYGYHIIFSLGAYKNEISLANIENVSISYLYETEAMKGTNKSLFDKMLELVDASTYSEYQASLIKDLRNGKTISYNKTAYERLYK
ncbi:MAG: hypothetical protein ACI4TI_02040 [Christensenellales bacterium]